MERWSAGTLTLERENNLLRKGKIEERGHTGREGISGTRAPISALGLFCTPPLVPLIPLIPLAPQTANRVVIPVTRNCENFDFVFSEISAKHEIKFFAKLRKQKFAQPPYQSWSLVPGFAFPRSRVPGVLGTRARGNAIFF